MDLKTNVSAKADAPLAAAVLAVAKAGCQIAKLAAGNGLSAGQLGQLAGAQNADGDAQKQLDVQADALIQDALIDAKVALYFSEEAEAPLTLSAQGSIAVACDPLDGSSNIDTNLTIGTIASFFAVSDCQNGLAPIGRKQLAAMVILYGPQTNLLMSFGDEVVAFALDTKGVFQRLDWQISIPATSDEFAINAANMAFWPPAVKRYIQTLTTGARKQVSGMRWAGSLVADAYRIFRRGGIFLYPQDSRQGYENGRLRLIYEANPIAFLIEAAGGMASTGATPILDVVPEALHQRVPFIVGSAAEVAQILSFADEANQTNRHSQEISS